MAECEPVDEPGVEDGAIVLRVLYLPTQHVFRCSFTDLQEIQVASTLREHVSAGSSVGRAAVAEFVRDYITENGELFAPLFAELQAAKED